MNLIYIMAVVLINSLCLRAADVVDKSRPRGVRVDKAMVHYKCSKGKPICFEAQLLDQSSVAKAMLNESNIGVKNVVKTLFKDYTPDQVRCIVRALALENQIQRDLIDHDISDVDVKELEIPKKRFLWLAEQAHELGIKNIYQELICNVARMTESLSAAYHEGHVLQGAIERDIVQCIDLHPYQKAIRALAKTEFPKTVAGRHYQVGKGCFSKDNSKWLVTEGHKRVMMHDTDQELAGDFDGVRSVRFSNNDQRILIMTDNGIDICDSKTGCCWSRFGSGFPRSFVTLSEDESLILRATKHEISLSSVKDNWRKWHCNPLHDAWEIKKAIISPDNKKVFVSGISFSGTNVTYVIHDIDQKIEHELLKSAPLFGADKMGGFSADSNRVLLYNDNDVSIYDLNTKERKKIFESNYRIEDVCFADNDTKLLIKHSSEAVLYNMLTGNEEWCIKGGQKGYRRINGVALSDDATRILLAAEGCKPIVFPVLNKTKLRLAQILLMQKVVGQWRAKQPYNLQPEDHDAYSSLPSALQTKKLFLK